MDFSIANEVYILLYSVLFGMIIAFLYDLFRTIRIEVQTGVLFSGLQDILFWCIATAIMFFLVFFTNDGRLRWYHIFGSFLGAVLYFLTLSRLFMLLVHRFISVFFKIFEFFLKILLTPLKFTYNIICVCLSFVISPVIRGFKRISRKFKKIQKACKTAFLKK